MPAPNRSWSAILAAALLPLLLSAWPAHANYPPQMEEADNYFHDWTYSAMSPDRHWLAYSSNARLTVVDTTGATPDRKFVLPSTISGLAIANSGRRLAIERTDGGPPLAELPEAARGTGSAELQWTELPRHCGTPKTPPSEQNVTPETPPPEQSLPGHVPPWPIALSGDGRFLATSDSDCQGYTTFIRVSKLSTHETLNIFPTNGYFDVRRIEFVDGDRKLAVFGGTSHALWDVRSGALIDEVHSDSISEDTYAYGTAFDRGTALAYIGTSSADVSRVALGDCGKHAASTKLPAGYAILTVGDGSSWYAVANGADIEVFQMADNRRIAKFKAEFDVAFLDQGRDPGTLIAVSRTKGQQNWRQGEALIPPDARHTFFHLPKELALAKPVPPRNVSKQCLLSGEVAGARDIKRDAPPTLHQAGIAFHGCGNDGCNLSLPPFDGCSFDASYAAWGKTGQGEIWIDHCSDIVRIDPRTGAVVEKIATPRNGKFVSITWFERGGFLNWQGDTVTFRSFHGERRVLVSKPGWHVNTAFVEGSNTFGVLWVKNHFPFPGKDMDPMLGPMGSGLAVRYDFDTLQVQVQMEAAAQMPAENQPTYRALLVFDPSTFNAETEDAPPTELEQRAEIFNAPNFRRTPLQASPEYRWEMTLFDSLRLLSTPAKGEAQALLWDGLTAWPTDIPAARPRTIFDFGDAKAAVVRWNNDVDLYDGKEHRILAHIPAQTEHTTNKVEWLANESVLAVDSCRNTAASDCRLDFYKVGPGKQ